MSCLLDIFSGYNMKRFISKHMTYRSRNKSQRMKHTNQSRTLATLMSLKDGTLSKQRQNIMNDADEDLSDVISIDSIHFDSGVSCNENDSSKLADALPRGLQTQSTLRIDQIRPLNGSVREEKRDDQSPSEAKVKVFKSQSNSKSDGSDAWDCSSSNKTFQETSSAKNSDRIKIPIRTQRTKLKNQTLPSKARAKTLTKTSKQRKVPNSYTQSLPSGKNKRKSPVGAKKDLNVQPQAGVFKDFENESNITQIYNNCNEKWTTIINLDEGCQPPPAESVGVIVDTIEPGNPDDDRNGRAHVVRWLLWNSAAEMPALDRSTSGALALHYASARGCLDCVKLLVETSLDLSANSQMDNDVTPVYLAAQEGHLDVLKFLVLEAGGSLYVRAKDGMAPIHAAAQMGCLNCLKWMVRDQGVDPNLKDGDGATPLHFAASRGHADCVRWLLRYGGKLVADKFGKSPINDAAENQQMECLSLLVQHGTLPDYHEEAKLHGKLHGCVCRKGESTKCSYADCVNYTPNSEPFYLHPPLSSSKSSPASPGLYINPMTNLSHSMNDPFYLHNPQEVMYNRVKDLFDSGGNRLQQPSSLSSSASSSPSPPPPPPQPMTVKVEVHSSSSGAGSEESSDLSERGSRVGDHDYEDIYSLGVTEVGPGGRKMARSRSRDSGHSRSGSVSSTASNNVVVHIAPTPVSPGNQPSPQPPSNTLCKMGARDELNTSEESGVSSASPSDLGHSEEEGEKMQQHAQTMKHRNQTNNRMLKRVVSDSGVMVPPPPPPLPNDNSMTSSSSGHSTSTEDEQSLDSSATLVEDRPLHTRPIGNSATSTTSSNEPNSPNYSGDHTAPSLINKQKALPFIPPKFPNNGEDSNALIKPSEYLKSICGTKQGTLRRSTSEMTLTSDSLRDSKMADVPPPPPLPPNQSEAEESSKERQSHQPLATISIQDLNSVQLRRTAAGKTMSVPLNVPGLPTNVPFSNQKNDLIAELKMSKDIIGIKKMKVERVKMEEKQEKEIMTEISRQFSVDVFVEKVGNIPDKDANGLPIPPWKRQMLAKKAAEKAKKELEEQLAREAEEKRMQSIPAWKRQLMQSKKGDETKTMKPSMHISIEENKPSSVIVLEKHHSSGDNQNYKYQSSGDHQNYHGEENNKENSNPKSESNQCKVEPIPEEQEEDRTTIMPWRSQLRKTNSTLNLLE